MKTSSTCIASIPLLVAGSIALSGCGRSSSTPTTISYRQVGICTSYVTESGTEEKAKTDEAFAVFKIEAVDNSKNGTFFNFDPQRLYVNQSDPETLKKNVYSWVRRFVNPDPRIGKALSVKYITSTNISKGEKLDDVGYALIPLATNNPTGGPDADKLNFKVTFDTGTGDRGNIESVAEGILITKTNPPDTAYSITENCKDLPLK
jgi:hypothetical protein